MENNETFLHILDTKLNKISKTNNDNIVKESVLCDIREFLIRWNSNFETAQSFIGWKYAFHGYIVKR